MDTSSYWYIKTSLQQPQSAPHGEYELIIEVAEANLQQSFKRDFSGESDSAVHAVAQDIAMSAASTYAKEHPEKYYTDVNTQYHYGTSVTKLDPKSTNRIIENMQPEFVGGSVKVWVKQP